jgi:pimeloyl-ACP methyl ester carboxylesterase
MRPERFAAVVAIEPVLFDPPRAPDLDSFAGSRTLADAARRRRNAFASAEEARARLRPRFPYAGMADEAFAAVLEGTLAAHEDGGVGLRCPGEREAWCYEGAASLDLWPLAARIEAPLLLVQGEHTALPALLRARLLAGRTRACVVSIPEATHFALLERPAEVGRAIGRFLAERVR